MDLQFHRILTFTPSNKNCIEECEAGFNEELDNLLKKYPCFRVTGPSINTELMCDIFCSSRNHGMSARNGIITPSMEMLVKPDDKKNLAQKISMKMNILNGDKDILIIDPYFFDGGVASFKIIIDIFKKSNIKLQNLYILSRKSEGVKQKEIEKNIESFQKILQDSFNNIELKVSKNDAFHDRFWVGLNSQQGVVMGTSLNGLAKRICIVEHISSDDVKEIVQEYQKLN